MMVQYRPLGLDYSQREREVEIEYMREGWWLVNGRRKRKGKRKRGVASYLMRHDEWLIFAEIIIVPRQRLLELLALFVCCHYYQVTGHFM